ncbi:MAG: LON peptidase substrate-binding domain-containing protein [Rhodospirillaceae bacterium]
MTNYRLEATQLPASLPIFPLTGVLLLPGGQLPLNIFEPRYLAMVSAALKTPSRLIGMVQPRVPNQADTLGEIPGSQTGQPEIYRIGCAGRIIGFNETPDGRNLITLHGITRFRITSEATSEEGFRRINADFSDFADDRNDPKKLENIDRSYLLKTVQNYFSARQITADWDQLEKADTERLITSLAMSIPFSPVERQALLESVSIDDRAAMLITMMEMAGSAAANLSEISH